MDVGGGMGRGGEWAEIVGGAASRLLGQAGPKSWLRSPPSLHRMSRGDRKEVTRPQDETLLPLVTVLQELARRTDTLIRLIEKENEEDEERNAASKKGGKAGGAPARKRAGSVTAASSADVKEGGDDGKEEVGSARKATRAATVSPAKK